jgi:hypothetical protein
MKFPYQPFAPLYFLGTEYAQRQKTNYFIYPLSLPNNNGTGPRLANQGAFGLKKHYMIWMEFNSEEKNQVELGFLLTGFINKKYSKTLLLKTDFVF